MIYDNISNLELYKGLSPDIYEGIKFLKEADASIANGVYQINPRVKAEMTIGNGYFAVFYPQDGHMPQLCIDEPRMVKKVVVKVQMNNR